MASTAAGVAVGHTMGQGLSSMLFGGSSSKDETPAPAPVQQQSFEERRMGGQCDIPAKGMLVCSSRFQWDQLLTKNLWWTFRFHAMLGCDIRRHRVLQLLPRAAQGLPEYVSIPLSTIVLLSSSSHWGRLAKQINKPLNNLGRWWSLIENRELVLKSSSFFFGLLAYAEISYQYRSIPTQSAHLQSCTAHSYPNFRVTCMSLWSNCCPCILCQ